MLVGKCPKCGAVYTGWALKSPDYQKCDRCGADLIIEDYQPVTQLDEMRWSEQRDLKLHMRRN